jgi:pimeloyl-ACP methyl ester carboxylesterase
MACGTLLLMARFVLIPGAGGAAWYWHRVLPLLEAGLDGKGRHEAVAVELPGDDESAGLSVYTERVLRAIGERQDIVLVAGSLGGFTAPLVSARTPLRTLVFVNAMIPKAGETAGEWWGNTGSEAARLEAARRGGYATEFDIPTYFLHDVPPAVINDGESKQHEQAKIIFREPCRFEAWPQVPIHVIAGRDDRFFPLEFQRRVARERLGLPVEELPGGHLIALSRPEELSRQLLSYL